MAKVPPKPAGISIREFAERDGCNDKLVRRVLDNGHLAMLPAGGLDPALVGTGWRERNRQASEGADTRPEDGLPDLAESRRRLEHIKAEMAQIELDLVTGKIAPIAPHIERLGKRLATFRTRLLAMPAEQAVAISRLGNPDAVEAYLRTKLGEALRELAVFPPP